MAEKLYKQKYSNKDFVDVVNYINSILMKDVSKQLMAYVYKDKKNYADNKFMITNITGLGSGATNQKLTKIVNANYRVDLNIVDMTTRQPITQHPMIYLTSNGNGLSYDVLKTINDIEEQVQKQNSNVTDSRQKNNIIKKAQKLLKDNDTNPIGDAYADGVHDGILDMLSALGIDIELIGEEYRR